MTFAAFGETQGAQAPYPTPGEIEGLVGVNWRHKHKGGRYRVEAAAKGAGALHGQVIVFYSDLPRPTMIYARPLSEWRSTMEPLHDE